MWGTGGRVVVLIDMDCFYCQVEARLNPVHEGKPLAVVQYNQWKGGGIIAVNYEARDKGVTRGMRGDEAKEKCPDIVLVSVASVRGKADLSKYRDAGKEVVDVFKEFCDCVERASIDEAYLDLTQSVEQRTQKLRDSGTHITAEQLRSTFVVGFCPDKSNAEDTRISGLTEFLEDQKFNPETLRLAVAAALIEELRAEVLRRTGFQCSAGIAHNKVLAKLVCGIHKPQRQTVLPSSCVEQLFSALPLRKVRNLGGKFGVKVVEELGCETMGDLARFTKEDLQHRFDEKTGSWLYEIARGIDTDPVTPRLIAKSIGCSKNFPGRNCLKTKEEVEYWMKELCEEVADRLSQDLRENKRRAQLVTVTVSLEGQSISRSSALPSYDAAKIAAETLSLISRSNTAPANSSAWQPAIKMIALSASKFVSDEGFRCSGIQSFFKQTSKSTKEDTENGLVKDKINNTKGETDDGTLTKAFVKPSKIDSSKAQPPKLQQTEIKLAVDPEGSQNEKIGDSSEPNKKGPKEKSFFLNYLQNLKSTGSTSASTTQSVSDKHGADVDRNGSNPSARNSLNTSGGSSLNISDRSDSLKPDKSDDTRDFVKEMFPNPLDVDDCVVTLLTTSLQEAFYSWRSQFRREKGFLSPEKAVINSRRNVHKVPVEFSSPKKQTENQKTVPKPNGGIRTFFQKNVKSPRRIEAEPHPSSKLEFSDPQPSSEQPSCSYQYMSEESNSRDKFSIDENSCDDMEKCSICHKMILLREFPEHVDYHAAVSLDERLNKVEEQSATVKTNAGQTVPKSIIPVKKRGRPPKNESIRPQNGKKLKSISSFFPVKGST